VNKGYVYHITNNTNQMVYVGVRKLYDVSPMEDEYLGGGVDIRQAIKEIGVENFTKRIVFIGSHRVCYNIEEGIVNQMWIDNPLTYNIALGGKR
jgi:hypothetical protein